MLGAVIGDIAGSRFEGFRRNYRAKDFEFFHEDCHFTDDSVMTLAVARAFLSCAPDFSDLAAAAAASMRHFGRQYPHAGYGRYFKAWFMKDDAPPYGSYGNGSAMRVSAAGWVGQSLDEVKMLSEKVTAVTHNHEEGIKGAEAAAVAVYLARTGKKIPEIKEHITENYYKIDFTIDSLRPTYRTDISCQGSVPEALEAFFESRDYEDAVRTAVSLGGDSDTIAAICGGVAEAYYGIPPGMRARGMVYLDASLLAVVRDFEEKYPPENAGNRKMR